MTTFYAALDAPTRAALRAAGTERRWPVGATVFREGAEADEVIVLTDGLAKAVSLSASGIETILALRGPGDVLGELAAVDGGPRSASIVAVEPVEALSFTVEGFRTFLLEHPRAPVALLAAIAARVRHASRRQVEFGSLDTAERLARLLVELADDYGEPNEDGVHVNLVSQEDLARLCGASRDSVARALRTLRDDGLVTTGRKVVVVRDLPALRDRGGMIAW